jgi:hypothetical protein
MKSKITNLILYVAIGLSCVALVIHIAYHPIPTKWQIDSKWIEMTIGAIVVFGTLIKSYWVHRKSVKLWVVLFGLVLLHFLFFAVVFDLGGRWSLPVKISTFTLETMLFAYVVYLVLGYIPYSRKDNPRCQNRA